MDSSKLKNIILITLAITNLFLVGMLLTFRRDALASEMSASRSLTEIFAGHGIELSEQIDVSAEAPEELILQRDMQSELSAVRSLLGSAEAYDQGGNVVHYSCRDGEARFRGTGEIEVIFTGSTRYSAQSVEQSAERVAKKLGVDPVVRSVSEGDLTVVELGWCIDGNEVFNSSLELSFSEESLLLVLGERAFDRRTGSTGAEAMDCSTVLVSFIALMQENNLSCSKIIDVSPGYLMSVSVSGEALLTPAWRIETDLGVHCINAVTGKEEVIAE